MLGTCRRLRRAYRHIAIKVLHAHLVVHAVVASFQHGPETLYPVCVRLAVPVPRIRPATVGTALFVFGR